MPIKQHGQAETVKWNMCLITTGNLGPASKYIIKYLTSSDKLCILVKAKNNVALTMIVIWKEQDLQDICIQD
jgi:hypothetical protein